MGATVQCPKCMVPLPELGKEMDGELCEECCELETMLMVMEKRLQGWMDLEQQLVTLCGDMDEIIKHCPF